MPSCPRNQIVRPGEVGVYHCWSRCVRRSWLCGQDTYTGRDYEYRREWIARYEQRLAGLFGIDVGFHGELANHIHVIVRTRPDIVALWSDEEVVRRWLIISHLVRSGDGQTVKPITDERIAKEMAKPARIAELRARLACVSNFMAALCEHVARRSNQEDGCGGHFWEDRFKCRDLADEAAILVCGMYIDLNQIRAGEALTPESSRHTSAYDRIVARQQRLQAAQRGECFDPAAACDGWLAELTLREESEQPGPGEGAAAGSADTLAPFLKRRASDKGLLPIELDDYLKLLDATGRIVRLGKSGSIPDDLAPILERLSINQGLWPDLVTKFDEWFGHVVGRAEKLVEKAAKVGRHWYCGRRRCKEAFG